MSLYLVWTRRKRLSSATPRPNLWALPILAGLCFGWLLADLADVLVVQQLALVGIECALVFVLLGTEGTRALLFPLGLLFFAVPLGEGLIPHLQDFTAWFAVKALSVSGIPALLEGRILSTPSARWEVGEACSGLRYLLSSLAVGFVFAGLAYRRWIRRISFLLASAGAPILANGLRVYGIVLLGYLTDNRLALGVDHLIYGWLFFGLVMALLIAVGWRWRDKPIGRTLGSAAASPPPIDLAGPGKNFNARSPDVVRRVALAAGASMVLLAFAPFSAYLLCQGREDSRPARLAEFAVSQPWQSSAPSRLDWSPRFWGATSELRKTYSSGKQRVRLYVAYYANETQGTESVSSMNALFDRNQWTRMAESTSAVAAEGESLRVRETILQSRHAGHLVWSWYWIAGEFTDSPYLAKFLLAKARLLRRSQAAALIAVETEYAPDRTGAAETLQDFLSHISLRSGLRQLLQ